MRGLVLSLFPGIDVLGMGFELEGWCVVKGPDALWGGDIHSFHPPAGRFDGVIGGPPCQAFSQLRHMVEAQGHRVAGNLIPEFERAVAEAAPAWFLMENVPDAPVPNVDGYRSVDCILDNHWLGQTAQKRRRRFSFGLMLGLCPLSSSLRGVFHIETPALVPVESEQVVTRDPRAVVVALSSSGKRKTTATGETRTLAERCELQGLPGDFFDGSPFTAAGKNLMIGNAVSRPMATAVARAVGKALETADAA